MLVRAQNSSRQNGIHKTEAYHVVGNLPGLGHIGLVLELSRIIGCGYIDQSDSICIAIGSDAAFPCIIDNLLPIC